MMVLCRGDGGYAVTKAGATLEFSVAEIAELARIARVAPAGLRPRLRRIDEMLTSLAGEGVVIDALLSQFPGSTAESLLTAAEDVEQLLSEVE